MPGRSASLSLNLLSLSYFAMGTAALAVVGTLPGIAATMGLGEGAVAFLVSVFAVTFAIGAPALQILVGHWPRKRLVVIGLVLLAAGSFVTALAPSYPVLVAARILAALGAAAIGPVASALGSSLVPAERQGHALAVVFSGMTIATVLGVPLSAWAGHAIGWRATFGLIGIAVMVFALLVAAFVRNTGPGQPVRLSHLVDVLIHPATGAGIAVMALEMAGVFASYTMITPMLGQRFGAGPVAISLVLLIYGTAGVLGNVLVRRIAKALTADRAVRGALGGLTAMFAGLALIPAKLPLAVLLLIFWAMASDIFMPSQQRRMVELAPEVRGLVLALNSSAIYIGMAVGAFAAGSFLPLTGLQGLPLVSVALLVLALAALARSRRAAAREARLSPAI